jgi:GT2 family glycosyltransferase
LVKARRLANLRVLELSWRFVQRRGLTAWLGEWIRKLLPDVGYGRWIRNTEPGAVELDRQRRCRFVRPPLVSIIVPTYNTPPLFLHEMLVSVREQTYSNWELCIADSSSSQPAVKEMLDIASVADSRIRVNYLPANLGIAGNSNAAWRMSRGDFVALLDHDDVLAPFALHEIVQALQQVPDADFLYSDEDKIDAGGGRRQAHHFKPDWSPETLRSQNYITHLAVFRRSLLKAIGGFRSGFDGSQDYDLILRAGEKARRVVHVPKVLYHWRSHPQSVAGDGTVKMYAYDAGKRALQEHLQRVGTPGEVAIGAILGTYRIHYALPRRPLVSIILAGAGHEQCGAPLLRQLGRCTYRPVEILWADRLPEPAIHEHLSFTAGADSLPRRLNAAAAQARGEVLLFLSPRALPRQTDGIERLLEHALRPGIGAVGGKIYRRDGSIHHAGYLLGVGGVVGQAHRHFLRSPGYGCRLITTQNLTAVAGACLMTSREVFRAAGGFDAAYERHYWDVDYCLRLRRQKHSIVWTPWAEFLYWESAPRLRADLETDSLQTRRDRRRFLTAWGPEVAKGDPYYNPNLSRDWEDFSLSA